MCGKGKSIAPSSGPASHMYLQGFEPSATTSMRRELRLMSRWSRWATRAQCMSRDFTHATLATHKQTLSHFIDCLENRKSNNNRLNTKSNVVWTLRGSGGGGYITFVLTNFLDPGQRVDFHEGVGNTDDMHHIHHTLTERETVYIQQWWFISFHLKVCDSECVCSSQSGRRAIILRPSWSLIHSLWSRLERERERRGRLKVKQSQRLLVEH